MGKNKTPKLFRKKFKLKKWKKLLKQIHIPSDRKMVEELFELQNDRMVIQEDISKEILKKLKPLAKSIKKNKGMVTKWKGLILLVLAGSILIFTFFFKNMLIEKGLEMSLEKIFQADVDVITPRFSLFKGEFSIQGLTVQDKDSPGKNLFETGPTSLSINIPELTRNRFRIETMILEDFQMNSSRESDFMEETPAESEGSKSMVDLSGLTDMTDDPTGQIKALIEEQKGNLKTLNFIDGAENDLDEFTAKWETEFKNSREEIEEFTSKYSNIRQQSLPSITNLEEGKDLITEYEGYYDEIQNKRDEIAALQKKFQQEKENLLNYKSEIEGLIQEDLAYLEGLLVLPGRNEMKDFVSDKIKEILMQRFQGYYDKAMKIMPYYEQYKENQKENAPAKVETKRLAGRTVLFPSPDSPKFLIETIDLSGGDDYSGYFSMNITGISSEPENWPDPVRLSSQWDSDSLDMSLQGFIDLKENAQELFHFTFDSPDNPISWIEGIPELAVESTHAQLSYLGSSYPLPEEKGIVVSLDMDFSEIEIQKGDQDTIIAKVLDETIQEIQEFIVTAELHITEKGIQSIDVKSDLDNILKSRLGDLLKDLPQQGVEELETVLRDMISENLLASDKVNETLENLNIDSLEQLNSLDDLKNQIKAVEDQAKGQTEALLKEYEDQARAEADRLLAEAEQKKKEAEAAAEAEKKKAEAEAEAKAKAEAEKLKDSIKIPGF
jgi:uncharacterized protein (TIGR03545 family)